MYVYQLQPRVTNAIGPAMRVRMYVCMHVCVYVNWNLAFCREAVSGCRMQPSFRMRCLNKYSVIVTVTVTWKAILQSHDFL